MAQYTTTIPDAVIPRIAAVIKPMLSEDEAADVENPTNAEILAKLKSLQLLYLKRLVFNHEKQVNNNLFTFDELGTS